MSVLLWRIIERLNYAEFVCRRNSFSPVAKKLIQEIEMNGMALSIPRMLMPCKVTYHKNHVSLFWSQILMLWPGEIAGQCGHL